MKRINVICIISAISTSTCFSYALHAEGIIGGTDVDPSTFTYQVAIQTRKNYTEKRATVCGGGILHDLFVISVAHCFRTDAGKLFNFNFLVFLGIDLDSPEQIFLEVDTIYIPGHNLNNRLNELAILKLLKPLYTIASFYTVLLMPDPLAPFGDDWNIIAGFGYTRVDIMYNSTNNIRKTYGVMSTKLKFGFVTISNDEDCFNKYINISSTYHFCGAMIPKNPGEPAGICIGDSGGPLVINNIVIGIAMRSFYDCDNTVNPAIYSKVLGYEEFIYSVLNESPIDEALIYKNPPHIRKRKRKVP